MRSNFKYTACLALLIILSVMAFKQAYSPYFNKDKEIKSFEIDGQVLMATYLYKETDQEVGFKNNKTLQPLVFTWKKPIYICFNMINVPYDLQIIFLDENKKIVGSEKMQKFSENEYCPNQKISYAIERINRKEKAL